MSGRAGLLVVRHLRYAILQQKLQLSVWLSYGAAWLRMVRRGSVMVRRGSVWCGVAQYGAAWLSMVQRGSVWCGVAQLAERRLAVRQARVRFSARHHREVFPTEHTSDEDMEKGFSEWRRMNVL